MNDKKILTAAALSFLGSMAGAAALVAASNRVCLELADENRRRAEMEAAERVRGAEEALRREIDEVAKAHVAVAEAFPPSGKMKARPVREGEGWIVEIQFYPDNTYGQTLVRTGYHKHVGDAVTHAQRSLRALSSQGQEGGA